MVKILSVFGFAVLIACGAHNPAPSSSGQAGVSNGRLIFLRGVDVGGQRIVARTPPLRPSCGACHGANGAGGIHLAGGAVSADLRHSALVTRQKHPYTQALVERAITQGIDNAGKALNPIMPRWRLSKRDLHDVAQFVLTQLQ